MKVAMVQFDIFWEDVAANIARVDGLLSGYQAGDLDLVVLPELWSCGFTMNQEAHLSFNVGIEFMKRLSQRLNCHLIGGLPAKVEGGQENRCYWVHPDGIHYYAKNKTFRYAGEHHKYIAGTKRELWPIGGFQVCPLICYDLRFPELPRGLMPQATLITYVANWPASRIHHWRSLLVARAIENQCVVIGVNRVGLDPTGLTYPGNSMVVLPSGEMVTEAGTHGGVYLAEISPEMVHDYRASFPFLDDMSP